MRSYAQVVRSRKCTYDRIRLLVGPCAHPRPGPLAASALLFHRSTSMQQVRKLVSKKELKSIYGIPYCFAHIARLEAAGLSIPHAGTAWSLQSRLVRE